MKGNRNYDIQPDDTAPHTAELGPGKQICPVIKPRPFLGVSVLGEERNKHNDIKIQEALREM